MQKTSAFSDFYCLPNKLALMGLRPWLLSAVPAGLSLEISGSIPFTRSLTRRPLFLPSDAFELHSQ
jgi:hypothetical protein